MTRGKPSESATHSNSRPRTEQDLRRRTLSQNFLRASAISQYLDVVDLNPMGLAIEVGAGDGALTCALATHCRELIAYELDPRMATQLRRTIANRDNVWVEQGDFLASQPPREHFQLVGNVPFSLTSEIVNWCLRAPALTSATIITQLEYAKKRAGSYGRWSLVTIRDWPWFHWELRRTIARNEFRPVPRVDAGVLHIGHRERPLVPLEKAETYKRIVELGFSGVGGSLFHSLARQYPRPIVMEAFRLAGVGRDVVVAFVNPHEWIEIFETLTWASSTRGKDPRRGN